MLRISAEINLGVKKPHVYFSSVYSMTRKLRHWQMNLTRLAYEFCQMKKNAPNSCLSFILKMDEKPVYTYKGMKNWPRQAHSEYCNIIQLVSYIPDGSLSFLRPSCHFYSVPFFLCPSIWFTVLTVVAIITINSVMTRLSVMILAPINFRIVALIIFWLSFDHLWYFLWFNNKSYCSYRTPDYFDSYFLVITYDYYFWPVPIKWV